MSKRMKTMSELYERNLRHFDKHKNKVCNKRMYGDNDILLRFN